MRRRKFIALLGGAAIAWPPAARAQQPDKMRHISLLLPLIESDPQGQANVAAFRQALVQLGWTQGRNIRMDIRWCGGNPDLISKYVAEVVGLAPDAIFAAGNAIAAPLLKATRTLPVVFAYLADPVGAGFVKSLRRPSANATGFMQFEYSVSSKWLELLKEIAPAMTRAAVLRDPAVTSGIGLFAVIQSVAPSLGVDVSPVNVDDAGEIEREIGSFARATDSGIVVTASALTAVHRDLIIALAARHKLPAVYYARFFARAGGLLSYGPNLEEQYRLGAGYIDRILRGEKPGDLPVQAPTKYELMINLRTAKALGLTIPPTLLARADELIE